MPSKVAFLLSSLCLVSAAYGSDVQVSEDSFGVPSIVAPDIKGASFAIGYIQGKDHAVRLSLNYKIARGRMAEVNGKSSLLQDTFVRSLGMEDRAASLAPTLTGEVKEVVEAYLQGVNKALEEQKSSLPAWVEPVTATDVLTLTQFVNAAFPLLDLASKISPGAGSNQFALSPTRTSTRHPILSIDPHLGWDGQDGGIVWQEFALYTPDIKFRGVAIPGLPIGVLGHNDKVAWSMTNNDPALYTIYTVKANPNNKGQYNYHGQWKDYETKSVEMRYLDNGVLKSSKSSVRLTAWGPIIPFSNRSPRFSIPSPDVTIRQGLAVLRSRSVADFRKALSMRGLSMWNFVYADTSGQIGYQYNAALPKRDESFDWRGIVPGEDPKSDWSDLLPMDDLPNALNPASGILVNCNSNPGLTPLGNEIKQNWPSYISTYGPSTRWQMLSELLKNSKRVNPAQAMSFATDCTVPFASATVARLSKVVQVGNAIEVLNKWDKKATVDSIGCVLYTYWLRENKLNSKLSDMAHHGVSWSADEEKVAQDSLASAANKMIAEQGSLTVRWGDVQYMQRGTTKTPVQGFGYVSSSSAIAAVSPASAGGATLKDGRSHATFGSSFRMIVSVEPKGIQSWSILPYGNSNVSTSPHFADQMPLYAIGKYKPTHFGEDTVRKYSVKSYHLQY